MKYINYIISLFKNIFTKKELENAAPKVVKKQQKREHFGSMYYLGDLLDSLDNYFKAMRVLRKSDQEVYDLFKNIGGQVVNSDVLLTFKDELTPIFLKKFPSFCMVHIKGSNNDDEKIPEFIYIRKTNAPFHAEKTNGVTYELGFFVSWDGIGENITCYVSVDEEGNIKLLRQMKMKPIEIHSKGKKESTVLYRKVFGTPDELRTVANYWRTLEANKDIKNDINAEYVANSYFKMCANLFFNAFSGMQINVSKNNVSALFDINMLRTPYFFKDREKTVNHNGQTKKIFHIVRGHKRKMFTGEKFIKSHFRGLRKFNWNGYEVSIKNPKNMKKLQFIDIESEDVTDDTPESQFISNEKAGELINYTLNR